MSDAAQEITQLLQQWGAGDEAAADQLLPLVYDQLHLLARSYAAHENKDHTLQATALVNEAYLRLIRQEESFQNRQHFFAIAARAMRRILVDYARKTRAEKRSDEAMNAYAGTMLRVFESQNPRLLVVDQALNELARFDSRQSQIVEMRFFAGLTVEDIARVLNISTATVKREWRMAKAWLQRFLGDAGEHSRAKTED